MSDEADVGNDNAELFLAAALANRKRMYLQACGHCYYCDETVQRGALFCSSECRDDHQKEQRIRQIKGH